MYPRNKENILFIFKSLLKSIYLLLTLQTLIFFKKGIHFEFKTKYTLLSIVSWQCGLGLCISDSCHLPQMGWALPFQHTQISNSLLTELMLIKSTTFLLGSCLTMNKTEGQKMWHMLETWLMFLVYELLSMHNKLLPSEER